MSSELLSLPYFPFFAGDWLASTSISMMTGEVEAAYIRLLCHQWRNGWLPGNSSDVQPLTKFTPGAAWKRAWAKLEKHFPVNEDGYRRNERLETERTKAIAKHEQQVQAGIRSAKARQDRREKAASERPTPVPTPVDTTVSTEDQRDSQRTGQRNGNNHNHSHNPPIRLASDSPPSAGDNDRSQGDGNSEPRLSPGLRSQYDTLAAVALPYQRAALDYLLSRSRLPDTLLGMVYAIAMGMQPVRSDNGQVTAGIEHTMLALAEMATKYYDNPEKTFSRRLLEECVRFVVNQTPKPTASDENTAKEKLRIAAPYLRFEEPATPVDEAEALRQRRAMMRKMWLDLGNADKAKEYDDDQPGKAAA